MHVTHVSGFDWDGGNREKCRKHGVTIDEIEAVFRNRPRVAPDPTHSAGEIRRIAVGVAPGGRAILVVFTLRAIAGATLIRPISARYMHRKEIEHFEQAIAPSGE